MTKADDKPESTRSDSDIDLPFSADWSPAEDNSSEDEPGTRQQLSEPESDSLSQNDDTPPEPPSIEASTGAVENKPVPADEKNSDPVRRVKVCPKCGNRQHGFTSCDRCGLIFAYWHPDMETALFKDIAPEILEHARTLWKTFTDSDPEEKETSLGKFHDYCQNLNAITFAAHCYRKHLSGNPDDEMVKKKQKAIISQSTLMLPTRDQKAVKKEIGRKGLAISIIVFVVLTILTTWGFFHIFNLK